MKPQQVGIHSSSLGGRGVGWWWGCDDGPPVHRVLYWYGGLSSFDVVILHLHFAYRIRKSLNSCKINNFELNIENDKLGYLYLWYSVCFSMFENSEQNIKENILNVLLWCNESYVSWDTIRLVVMTRLNLVKNINFGLDQKNFFWHTEKLYFGSLNIFV